MLLLDERSRVLADALAAKMCPDSKAHGNYRARFWWPESVAAQQETWEYVACMQSSLVDIIQTKVAILANDIFVRPPMLRG